MRREDNKIDHFISEKGKEDLKNINVPVLALMAEKSTMHNSGKAVETGKKYVKDIDIVNWKNASHAINGEFSNEVNARILNFIENPH